VHETLDENECMMHETLNENRFYEICMDVWSCSNEWNLFFFFLRRNIWTCGWWCMHKWMDAIPSRIIFFYENILIFFFFAISWGCINEWNFIFLFANMDVYKNVWKSIFDWFFFNVVWMDA